MNRLEKKLERPPYVHNWIRNIGSDLKSTTKILVRLALGFPTKTYGAGAPIIRDCIAYSLDRETAIIAAMTTGRINSRPLVTEYVSAFCDFDETRKYSGKPTYDEMVEPFRIGKGLSVPVKPLVNIVENGKLIPIFSVGWASMPFNKFQQRLFATVLEDAIFSLTDFRMSTGEFIFFPRESNHPDAARKPIVWKRGDMEKLSAGELSDCLHMYSQALEAAKTILREMPQREIRPGQKPESPHPDQYGFDL
ncbi:MULTISPECIES: hypothetical protein [unclassified Rhizobium]|uniref:hypothetical protein n=1 Tax=unclassified Rhizobium TaxID=2613769 RepID=UPI0006FEFC5F|nr:MULTISPECIES: hypothetical protein [unclassified Rhizobium]KQV38502.1 hypothetical protein ASC86_09880 [Rhizobium sp. Root1212]KRD31155.1 hypothetical protein ASE37_09875 [Rhizobium sp. Root268]